jgi:hypothetical protein
MSESKLLDLIKSTQRKIIEELESEYNSFVNDVNTRYKDVPHLLEFIEKFLEWENDKTKRTVLFRMFPSRNEDVWFSLWLIIFNYVDNHRDYDISWVDVGGKVTDSSDLYAQPVIVASQNYHYNSAKDLLDAMNQFEVNQELLRSQTL